MVAMFYYQLSDVRLSWQYDRVFDAFGHVSPSQATSDSQDSIGIKIGIRFRFRGVRVVLLVLFYNGAFSSDSFRFRPVHYPRRWTKVIRSLISF